ncbi:MAG: hypothetical protein KatS3mg031_1370 [Chitinophagales bacterium]|nr:MAG: hypothetical protein KatS3mg031_1370 [Chitinophagales bacterium]
MRDFGLSEHIIAGMLLVVGFLSVAGNAWGQGQVASGKETTTSRLVWVDVVESVKFHKRWSLQAEVSERFFFDPVQQSQAMMRVYGFYNAGEGWSLGPVFSAWVNRTGSAYTYELRPAQAFVYRAENGKGQKAGNTASHNRRRTLDKKCGGRQVGGRAYFFFAFQISLLDRIYPGNVG